MRLVFFVLLLSFSVIVNAENINDNVVIDNDYTLIDCIQGNDENGVVFDSTKPYQTLKGGIEKTIEYINSNINISGNENIVSGKIFNIKVNCSTNNILDTNIVLGFKGTYYDNELLIEGIGDNGLIIQKTKFILLNGGGGIIFKNAKFLNEYIDYFEDKPDLYGHPNSNGITIKDSYISLNNNINFGLTNTYNTRYWSDYAWHYVTYTNYENKQKILNSKIEINLDGNYDFKIPFYLKDSQINFKNNSNTGIYDISFNEDGNIYNLPKVDYGIFVSNEIDFGGNNINVENNSDIGFINNKFANFNNFDLGGDAMFFNNTFENISDIDITSSHYLLNNVFKNKFIDTYDKYNLRKNYQNNEIGEKGIGWIFKIKNTNDFFNIDLSSNKLYKEITGIDIEGLYNSIYVIFSK